MFLAAWSAYGFETAICYTSEFRNPGTDTFKAIFYSGLLCIALYILVPFTFQGALGLAGMLDPGIGDGSGVASAMADMVGGGAMIHSVMIMLMILALVLSIMTAMAGSSRTLYQGSVDGWLPKYLSHINSHARAHPRDVDGSLLQPDPARHRLGGCHELLLHPRHLECRLHHLQLPQPERRLDPPYGLRGKRRVPSARPPGCSGSARSSPISTPCSWAPGAKTWNPMALWAGLFCAALILPVFCYRHYIQDKGKFPTQMLEDLHVGGSGDVTTKRAGILPYLTLIAGVAVVLLSNWFFKI